MNQNNSLSKEIYEKLKEQILCLHFEPGKSLTEKELADKFNSSKTPVREALNKLSAENLVYVIPHKGYRVTEISYGELIKLFQYRAMLEAEAAEFIIEHRKYTQLQKLEELSNIEPEPFEEGGYTTINPQVNDQFHLHLIAMTENPMLIGTHMKTMEQLKRVLLKDTNENTVQAIKNEHGHIVALIKDGNIENTRKYIKDHIQRTMERVIKSI